MFMRYVELSTKKGVCMCHAHSSKLWKIMVLVKCHISIVCERIHILGCACVCACVYVKYMFNYVCAHEVVCVQHVCVHVKSVFKHVYV